MRGEHGPGSRVAGFLHAHLVARRAAGSASRPRLAGHAAGDQELLRQAVHPPAAPQVPGEGGAQSGAAPAAGQSPGGPGARASPGPAPGRAGRSPRSRGCRAAGRSSRCRRGAAARPLATASPCAGPRPGSGAASAAAGRPGCPVRDERARAVPSFDPPLREQLGVGAGDDGPADPECGGERPGRRQSLAGWPGGRPVIGVPELARRSATVSGRGSSRSAASGSSSGGGAIVVFRSSLQSGYSSNQTTSGYRRPHEMQRQTAVRDRAHPAPPSLPSGARPSTPTCSPCSTPG